MLRKVKNKYHFLQSAFANLNYGFPGRKLNIIGVTGTSGKTTTTLMIYEMLKAAGYKVSVVSTIKGIIGGKEYDTGFHVTTPSSRTLLKYLRQAVKNGDRYFVLEVSSHALDQNRVAFVPFKIGVLTTLAHEHLDYHKTLANYAKAKAKLLHSAQTVVMPVNALNDDLKEKIKYDRLEAKVKTFGLDAGDETQKKWQFSLRLPGDFNLKNALAAATVGSTLGIDKAIIKNALELFSNIPGRVEEIPNKRGYTIINDFAHKPDALEEVLLAARKMLAKQGRVIVMYGCASQRDVLKRPMMGEISGRLADITVLTDEDPRFEEPMKIIDEIAEGCTTAGAVELRITNYELRITNKKNVFFKIPDRQQAIDFIINQLAQKDDIILFCGKGHEQSMNYKGIERPWSEHEAVRKALRNVSPLRPD